MSRDPAFLMYSKDWLQGTAEMLPDEKGIYIDLLCHQHQTGSLPIDIARLAKTVGIGLKEFKKAWSTLSEKFIEKDGRLINKRLEKEVNSRAETAHRNKIAMHFGLLIRMSDINAKKKKEIKEKFKIIDYINYSTEEATSRLTLWFTSMVNHTEDGNGDANGNEDGNGNVLNKNKDAREEKNEAPHPEVEIHPLIAEIIKHFPRVQQMKEPLTNEQARALSEKHGSDLVLDIASQMHNYNDLIKKNISANLTITNWLNRRKTDQNGISKGLNQSRDTRLKPANEGPGSF